MPKKATKSTNVKCTPTKHGFNPGKPVVYMVAALLTCICMSLGGFMLGYNVGVKNVPQPEIIETTTTDTTEE